MSDFLDPMLMGTAITLATPVVFATFSELFAEQSGTFNFGLEGIMLIGAVTAYVTTFLTGNLLLGLGSGIFVGALMGLIVAVFSVSLCVNQIVLCLGVFLFGVSASGFVYTTVTHGIGRIPQIPTFAPWVVQALVNIPWIGNFFKQTFFVYLTILLIPVIWYFFDHTMWGLKIRACGINPWAADAMGVRVYFYKYLCLVVSGVLAALGGLYLVTAQTGFWAPDLTAGSGFIGVAVLRAGNWKSYWAFIVSYMYGFLVAVAISLTMTVSKTFPYEYLLTIPYIAAILALLISYKWRLKGQPAALGKPYTRKMRTA